jgi:hypothetical protein
MAEVYQDAQGAPIAPENLANALSSGNAYGIPDADYTLKDPGGNVVKVKGAEIPKALGSGFSIVPPDIASIEERRQEIEGAPIQTMLEGAASTVSLGATDALARAIAPEYEDRAAERALVNPGNRVMGEVGGMLLPNPASGIAGLVGRAVKGAEAGTAAARMAQRAAGGALTGGLEGALYGAGSELSAESLENKELTAEKLLSGAGHGAAFGGLLGGLGGVVAGRIDEFSRGRAARAEHAAGEMDSLLSKKTEALTEKLRSEGVAEERIAERVAAETAKLSKKTSAIEEFANAQAMRTLEPSAAMLKERAARAGATVDDLVQQAGSDYLGYEIKTGPMAGKRIFHGAKNPVDVIDDVGHALKETRASVGHFEEMAERSALARPEILPDAAPIQATLNSVISTGRKPTAFAREIAADVAPVLVAEAKVGIHELRAASDAIAARIEGTSAPAHVRQLSEVKRALDDSASRATRDALASAGVDSAGYAEAQRVHRSLSLVHDAIAEMKLSTKSGKADGGLPGYALAATLLGNFPHGLAAGASLLASKIVRERAGGIAAEVAHRVASSDVRLGWGAKAIAGDAWRAAKRTANETVNAAPLIRRVQEITSTPDGPSKYAGDQVAPIAQYPDLAQAASTKIIGDLQYLAAHAPGPVGRGSATMTPAAAKSDLPPKAAAEWFERARALQDPGIVVDEVLKGRVPTAAIEALKERRPLLWEKMRADVAQEVALRGDEMPFKRRITIGLAFDFAADRSLQPGAVRAIQTNFAPEGPQAPNGLPTAGPGRPSTPKPPDMGSMQSMTQQIASEG